MGKYLVVLFGVMLGVYGAGQALLLTKLTEYNFSLLFLIPIFFVAYGVVETYLCKKYMRNNGITLIMSVKVAKILLSLLILFLYVLLVKDNSISFAISYLIFFMSYLLYETWMLTSLNKKTKK